MFVDKKGGVKKRKRFVLKGVEPDRKGHGSKKLSVRERADNFILNEISNIPSDSEDSEVRMQRRKLFFEQKKKELFGKLTQQMMEKKREKMKEKKGENKEKQEKRRKKRKRSKKNKKRYKSQEVNAIKKARNSIKESSNDEKSLNNSKDILKNYHRRRSFSVSKTVKRPPSGLLRRKSRVSSKSIRRSKVSLSQVEKKQSIPVVENNFDNILENFVKNMNKADENNSVVSNSSKPDSRVTRILKKRAAYEKQQKIEMEKKRLEEEKQKELEQKKKELEELKGEKVKIKVRKTKNLFLRPKLSFSTELSKDSFIFKTTCPKTSGLYQNGLSKKDEMRDFLDKKLTEISGKGILNKKRKKKKRREAKKTKAEKEDEVGFIDRLKQDKKNSIKKKRKEPLKGNFFTMQRFSTERQSKTYAETLTNQTTEVKRINTTLPQNSDKYIKPKFINREDGELTRIRFLDQSDNIENSWDEEF